MPDLDALARMTVLADAESAGRGDALEGADIDSAGERLLEAWQRGEVSVGLPRLIRAARAVSVTGGKKGRRRMSILGRVLLRAGDVALARGIALYEDDMMASFAAGIRELEERC